MSGQSSRAADGIQVGCFSCIMESMLPSAVGSYWACIYSTFFLGRQVSCFSLQRSHLVLFCWLGVRVLSTVWLLKPVASNVPLAEFCGDAARHECKQHPCQCSFLFVLWKIVFSSCKEGTCFVLDWGVWRQAAVKPCPDSFPRHEAFLHGSCLFCMPLSCVAPFSQAAIQLRHAWLTWMCLLSSSWGPLWPLPDKTEKGNCNHLNRFPDSLLVCLY